MTDSNSKPRGKSKSTTTPQGFLPGIGPTCDGGETLPRFRHMPTPNASDAIDRRDKTRLEHLVKYGKPKPKPTGGEYQISLTEAAIADGTSISFQAASPAKTSATPGQVQGLPESEAAYGTSTPVSFAHFDPDGCLWKTWQLCLHGGLMPYSGRWCRSGMIVNGIAYRLQVLVPRISGTGCSLLPTPTTQEVEHPEAELTATGRRKTKDGQASHSLNLADTVRRSLQNTDVPPINTGNATAQNAKGCVNVQPMFPTPYGLSANKGQGDGEFGKAIRNWPTPAGTDWKGQYTQETVDRRAEESTRGVRLPEELARRDGAAGQLNPTWVEWLMGFPLGWTDLDASETP
jgi:hypothetical protein